MDFWQLEIFIKIVELKSFSKAATAICITQPTVTSHIQSLENELDMKLLDRLAKEAVPTAGGKVLYEYAKRLVALKDEARQSISHIKGKVAGSVIVGGSTIPGEYLLPMMMGGFRKEYPGITVSQVIGDSAIIAEKVLKGECEIGVIGSRPEDKGLTQREFIQDELILIAGPDFPLPTIKKRDVKELLKIPFVIRERGSGSRAAMEKRLSEMGVDPGKLNIVAEMGSTEAIKQAVKAGLGLSIVSSLAVAEDLHYKTLIKVSIGEKKLMRSFYIITSRQRSKSPACQAFLNFLTN
jgi:DNA-binding transcriptional LysR family regulator